jgi:hypothetical protein
MSEQNSGQIGDQSVSGRDRWKRRFGLMGIAMVALLLLPPFTAMAADHGGGAPRLGGPERIRAPSAPLSA